MVDPVSAEVVKRIFCLANEGKSPRAIADILTADKVLIPAAHAKKYHPEDCRQPEFHDPYLWGVSTIRKILDRQEYLGHTILHKSVGTNFKLHKRKETPEDEQYVFYHTHEPIVSQELWDAAQKARTRATHKSAWGTHHHRLTGYLYCADCGKRLNLQTHYSKKDRSVYYSFRCSGYANKIHSCTAHSIGAETVENLLLSTVQRFSRFVLTDEAGFVRELQSKWLEKQECKPEKSKSELKRLQKRHDELDGLVRGLYEHFVSGILPERQYKQLMKQYDDEQAEIEDKIREMEETDGDARNKPPEVGKFIATIRKYKNPTEVTDIMFHELIDKMIVHEGTGQGEKRAQQVDIYFNFIGQYDVAYTEAELAEQEAQKERLAVERLARQREREKGYREKRKAKKIAENGGVIVPKKVCPCCGEEFTPTSNRQVFCTPNCRYVYAQNEKKAVREAERGDHYYRQRNCMVCGKLFWPTHSQQTMCSDECRKKHHSEVTLEAYHKRQAEKRNGGHPYPERQCEVCGKKFWPDSPSAKVCSEGCRQEKKRREKRARYAQTKGKQTGPCAR